jgi:hypothetical protein
MSFHIDCRLIATDLQRSPTLFSPRRLSSWLRGTSTCRSYLAV